MVQEIQIESEKSSGTTIGDSKEAGDLVSVDVQSGERKVGEQLLIATCVHDLNGSATSPFDDVELGGNGSAEEDLWRKRLWFVRVPKPPEVGAFKVLEHELETYRAQHKLLTESLNVKKVERDSARENTRVAKEAFALCKAAFEDKFAIVQPLRDAAKSSREEADELRQTFGELEVRTLADLDDRLMEMNYRISHESIPLKEEKLLLQQIKKLESQRWKVQEYEERSQSLAEVRTEVKRFEGELADHKAELDALYKEKKVQLQILSKFREQEKEIDIEVEEVLSERRRVKDILDEVYNQVAELKSMQKSKNDEYYSNRRFSRSIRELLSARELNEARELCSQQMEEAHQKMISDSDYRAEYFALWDQQRKTPVSMAFLQDIDSELPPPSKKKGRVQQQAEVEPAKKAEQVIAAVLEEAREEIMRVKTAAVNAAVANALPPMVAQDAPAETDPPKSGKPMKGNKEILRHSVQTQVVSKERFEIPEAIRARKAASAEEIKASEREHQRQLKLDAERRKHRKQQEREKKKLRAQEEAVKARKAVVNFSSATYEPKDASDQLTKPALDRSHDVPAASAAVSIEHPPLINHSTTAVTSAASKTPKVANLTSKPPPKARRPTNTKRSMANQFKIYCMKNRAIRVGLGVLLFLTIVLLWWSFF